MIWSEIFGLTKKCKHNNVPIDQDICYCPDCGELVENQWYLVRCACCSVKLEGIIKNRHIVPEKHFCHNCGGREFVVERINKINFIDISYAVLVKAVVNNSGEKYTQSWIDNDFRTLNYRPRLLQQFQ